MDVGGDQKVLFMIKRFEHWHIDHRCISFLACLKESELDHLYWPNNTPLPVFPTNKQFSLHFREFCLGYRVGAEAVEVKFPHSPSTRNIKPFSVGIVDGFLKTLTMTGIVLLADQLASWHSLSWVTHGQFWIVLLIPILACINPTLIPIWGFAPWRHCCIGPQQNICIVQADSVCIHTLRCAKPLRLE